MATLKNFRQVLPVRSGSSEFFNTDSLRQARGFVSAAKKFVARFSDLDIAEQIKQIVLWVKYKFSKAKKRLPESFRLEVVRIYQTLEQEKAA